MTGGTNGGQSPNHSMNNPGPMDPSPSNYGSNMGPNPNNFNMNMMNPAVLAAALGSWNQVFTGMLNNGMSSHRGGSKQDGQSRHGGGGWSDMKPKGGGGSWQYDN